MDVKHPPLTEPLHEPDVDRDLSWDQSFHHTHALLFVLPPSDLLRQYLSKEEEVPAEQQLFTRRGRSGQNQDPAEPPRIKEEQEEAGTSQVKEELCRAQKDQDSDAFMMPLTHERQPEPEPNRDRILSCVFPEVQSGDDDGSWQEDFKTRALVECDAGEEAFNKAAGMKRGFRIHSGEKLLAFKALHLHS